MQSITINWSDTDWETKEEYLADMAEDYDIDPYTVDSLADLLGDSELFDGLLVALEDYND